MAKFKILCVTTCVFKYIRSGLALLLSYYNIVLFSTLSFNLIKYHSAVGGFFCYSTFICLLLCNLNFFLIVSNQLLVNL